MDTQLPDAAPAVLTDLVAAGLVSHEMIGDPARLAGEAAALAGLCARVGGTVYRLGAFHYAFRAAPADLDGRLAALAPGDWTLALEAALQAALGADAVWLNPAAGPEVGADAALDEPLLLLRAREGAVAEGLTAAPPGMRAVVDACYAAEIARLIAGAAPGSALAARLASIEARQAELAAHLAAREEAEATATDRLAEALAGLQERIGAQSALLEEIAARPDAFEARLGLALAEFQARIEQRAAAPAPARALSTAGQEA
jgi:hypothetical protein